MDRFSFMRNGARRVADFLSRLRSEVSGNVLMIFGFAMIPMVFATGMGIDYARAAKLRTKMNALADAAALAGVTQPMMLQDTTAAEKAARAIFNTQAALLTGVSYDPANLSVTISQPDGMTSRTIVVSYTAQSLNAFSGVLGRPTIEIGGSSTANAVAPPNMDFYIALDTSPSMALPTTSAGIATMHNALNCSFACHSNKIQNYVQANKVGKLPSLILDNSKFNIIKGSYTATGKGNTDTQQIDANGAYIYVNRTSGIPSGCSSGGSKAKDICVYNKDGTYVDSYWYALNQGIPLRVTAERSAVQDLMVLAGQYAQSNKRTYRAGIYTFDHYTNFKTILAMPAAGLGANLDAASTAATNIDLVQVNDQKRNGSPPNGSTGADYYFTSFSKLLDMMQNTILPSKSGTGTDNKGDTPQGFLFIVTDGMSDEGAPSYTSSRTRSAMLDSQITQCNAIRNKGFKIAILYTEYTSASVADDEPNQRQTANNAIPNIAPQLTKCASPGLMYTVKTDESLTAALQALFAQAVATARLTN